MDEPKESTAQNVPDLSVGKPLDREKFPHPSASGRPLRVTLENLRYLLKKSRVTARYDVIGKRLVFDREGEAFSELQVISLASEYGMTGPFLQAFLGEIGLGNPCNPVKDWIGSKPWDGRDRLPELFATVEVAEGYPEQLKRALLYRWLLSATAAAMLGKRKFSARGVLTLQGPQGIGKTSWIAGLVPDPVLRDQVVKRDHHMDGGNKDSILSATRHWIVEIGELDGAFRKDIARLKGFITNDCDKIRPPYGKTEIEMPRRTVFAATVNDATFLVDPTGNSRFWTIAVSRLDYSHSIDMQQVFAQLSVAVEEGAQWWLTSEEEGRLASYNLQHRAVNAIAERVKDHIDIMASGCDEGNYMTATELLKDMGLSNPTNMQAKECGTTLREILGPPKRVQGRDQWRIVRRDDFRPDVSITLASPQLAHPRPKNARPEDEF